MKPTPQRCVWQNVEGMHDGVPRIAIKKDTEELMVDGTSPGVCTPRCALPPHLTEPRFPLSLDMIVCVKMPLD